MSAESVVTQVITDALADVQVLQDTAIGYGDTAQTVASTVITGIGSVPGPTEPDVTIPPFSDPSQDLGQEFRTEYNNSYSVLDASFRTELTNYLTTYFPSLTSCITTFQNWLCNQITSGGTGVNAAVENALFQRGRDRLQKEQSREGAEVIDEFASRGWTIPSSVLADMTARSQQNTVNQVSALNREIVIESWKTEVEMTKFAVERYSNYYIAALGNLREYLLLFFKIPEESRQKASEYISAKRRLWEAAAAYYRALIEDAQLTLNYDEIRARNAIETNRMTLQAIVAMVENRTGAAVGSAEAIAKIAAARSAALNTLAEIAHQTNKDE